MRGTGNIVKQPSWFVSLSLNWLLSHRAAVLQAHGLGHTDCLGHQAYREALHSTKADVAACLVLTDGSEGAPQWVLRCAPWDPAGLPSPNTVETRRPTSKTVDSHWKGLLTRSFGKSTFATSILMSGFTDAVLKFHDKEDETCFQAQKCIRDFTGKLLLIASRLCRPGTPGDNMEHFFCVCKCDRGPPPPPPSSPPPPPLSLPLSPLYAPWLTWVHMGHQRSHVVLGPF
jgi:hypothetical protein